MFVRRGIKRINEMEPFGIVTKREICRKSLKVVVQLILARMGSGTYNQAAAATMTLNADTLYHVKVVAQGSSIKVYVDNVLKIDSTDGTWTSGAIGVRCYFTKARFDNIEVR